MTGLLDALCSVGRPAVPERDRWAARAGVGEPDGEFADVDRVNRAQLSV
ncbi:hypothetical protein ACFPER_09390 [Agromyces aurantiacus]|uniref:Uncharacterized protein n=1 Tax=Agromyces aurantiacus TaxID=165814 RepID=A0ABV9R4E5_9MICO|nr:hypothetical protein [Agromyces aurantiacus]MBM7503686.1 hypothetical protein [Agromyces aurantiacus]